MDENKIDFFVDGEIGINILNSFKEDVEELSKYIQHNYNLPKVEKSLIDYFNEVIREHSDNPWAIMVFDQCLGDWNAYRNGSTDEYLEEHSIYSAAEIIGKKLKTIEVKEEDIMDIFM